MVEKFHIGVLRHSEMAENPNVVALWQNIAFIQESMATGGLYTIAGRLDLVTRQYYYDLATCGRAPVDQAAMLMRTVMSRIRDNPDVYFTRFIEALRRSHLVMWLIDWYKRYLKTNTVHVSVWLVIGGRSLPLMHY